MLLHRARRVIPFCHAVLVCIVLFFIILWEMGSDKEGLVISVPGQLQHSSTTHRVSNHLALATVHVPASHSPALTAPGNALPKQADIEELSRKNASETTTQVQHFPVKVFTLNISPPTETIHDVKGKDGTELLLDLEKGRIPGSLSPSHHAFNTDGQTKLIKERESDTLLNNEISQNKGTTATELDNRISNTNTSTTSHSLDNRTDLWPKERHTQQQNARKQVVGSPPLFTIAKDFSFPHRSIFKKPSQVLTSSWVRELKYFLASVDQPKRVILTVATSDFTANLLNWLISAQVVAVPPLENILVVCFDASLHDLLNRKRIDSIYVPYSSILKTTHGLGIGKVWMTRMAVIRLINHLGFDVQQFDTDAIILRNPQEVFELYPDYDIVGARAMLPFELGKGPWGFTVSMGAVLFRNTPRTELLWKTMGTSRKLLTNDDQKRLNFALYHEGMKWQSTKVKLDRENTGVVNKTGLKVVVLPPIYICRGLCKLNHTIKYYVWHQVGGGHVAWRKSQEDAQSHTWFLKRDWKSSPRHGGGVEGKGEADVTGRSWLEYLAGRKITTMTSTPDSAEPG